VTRCSFPPAAIEGACGLPSALARCGMDGLAFLSGNGKL
jgi:hypothetical protein